MLLAKTHKTQSALAQFCRTGKPVSIEGAVAKNLVYYRRLVFNNVIDSLSTAYPITKKMLKDDKWEALVNRFFSNYNVQSPQIWYMPKEFMDYVLTFETTLKQDLPFLENLLLFEWTEVEVFMMPDTPKPQLKNSNLYTLNPEIKLLKLDFPVHLKNAQIITLEDKATYFVSLHRHPKTGSVQFTNLSVPYVDVLEQLYEQPLSETKIKTILKKYAPEEAVNKAFKNFINQSLATQLIFN